MAAGGFVARSFEAMLKECGSNKKYNPLQTVIRTYLESGKGFNQQSSIGESEQRVSASSNQSVSCESDSGAQKVVVGSDQSTITSSTVEELEPSSRPVNSSGSTATVLANAVHALGESEAELVLNPLRLAFETKNIKLVELALGCLHKLIEYNLLEGDLGLHDGKDSKILTDILKMVCSCVNNSAPDSTTLQVLKVLLVAIASLKIRVHGELLLGIIQACTSIALNSKSPINQATSKSMLTQMLTHIFRPLETAKASSTSEPKEAYPEDDLNTIDEASTHNHNDLRKTLDNILFAKLRNNTPLASFDATKNIVNDADIKGLEAILEKAVNLEDGGESARGTGLGSMSVEQCDASLIFRTLCKMSMKVGKDEVTTKTRILSLELLQGSLEDVEHSLIKNIQLVDSVRAHLSYALLKAAVSQSPILFQYATGIFAVILLHFREGFKAEIGVLFPVIVLRTLDRKNTDQKLSVLQMLEKVCKDPRMLVDLYINYDCDLEAPNLFDRMVASLSKLGQSTPNVDPKSSTAFQTASIKTSSLQGLVNVLKSLASWEKSNKESQKQSNGGVSSEGKFSSKEVGGSRCWDDSTYSFEKLQDQKSTIEAVVYEFNRQPGKDIQSLISSQLVENTPASVAQFLQNTPNLDKAVIGEYLTQHEELSTAVLHAYVESMNFSGMRFDVAMLEFLKGFELPREAQKIDCIIEKFTAHYCANNPNVFKNVHAAYVLAYSIIMLNADASDPMVRLEMSESDFLQINTINDAEGSAPQELLEGIYGSIVKEETKLKFDPAGVLKTHKQNTEVGKGGSLIKILNLSLPKRSSSTDPKSESEAIIKQIQALIKDQGGNKGVFYTSNRIELLCPMVEAVGWPLLATFSVTMGEVYNKSQFSVCMQGFKRAIHITHVLGMNTMRYAFLTSLLRYNSLHAPKDIRHKNIEALRTLLALCNTETHALEGCWFAILECVSRLEFIVSWPAITATVMQGANQITREAVVRSLRELSGKPTEQVFLNSIKLPSESVVEFFTALCNVSAEELRQNPARVFSLLKMVEVSYYNKSRIRMVWARIWSVLAQHFIFAGGHSDENVSVYCIDSLQKLSMKYLEHDEIAGLSFQEDILKPFVVLMQSSKTETIRKLILDSIVQVIKSRFVSIKSGWHSVFRIFTRAAADDLESIVEQAFENVEQVILEHFDQLMGHCFMDCVNCLMGFANNKKSLSASLKAVALFHICADRLAESFDRGGSLKHIDVTSDEAGGDTEQYWFPMLASLSNLTSDPRSEVRNCAIEVLFDLMNRRGRKFSSSFWEKIFQQVLFPIFDCIQHAGKESFKSSGDDWHHDSCMHALQLLCNLFSTFYKDVSFMLSPLLSLLLDCAKSTDQSVVSISLGGLAHLIEIGGHQFSDHDWDTLLKSIRDASYKTRPLELLDDLGFENTKHPSNMSRHLEVESLETNVGAQYGNLETLHKADAEGYEGSCIHLQCIPSPSGTATRTTDGEGLQDSQTFGEEVSGNTKKNLTSDAMVSDISIDLDTRDGEEQSSMLRTIRSKCMTQLLLQGIIDSAQKKYWNKLSTENKITIMEILFSVLQFASSYNSYTNLRLRIHQIPAERPPLNLIRLELSGTCIYLDILQKTATTINCPKEESDKEDKIEGLAEQKLISFCELVLRDASNFQSSVEKTADMSIHQALELRSPIIVKVLTGMCQMNPEIFRNHLRDFYPYIAKLVCCQQMDIRGALADLFNMQLGRLLTS